jgi:branched-chain amino acid transport system substrate-binding protein
MSQWTSLVCTVALFAALAAPAPAQKQYDPGASDSEIRIGQTMPYSGPVSVAGTVGRAELAFFAALNAQGGINGRKVTLISLDDGYVPAKTVEQVRRLVESERVLFIFGSVGTPTNAAVQKYLNAGKVPQLFITGGAAKFGDPVASPWTMGWLPTYATEGAIIGQYILKTIPDARIAILYQNDDLGRDYIDGFKQALGPAAAKLIVRQASFETSDPTVDSEIVELQASGANVLFYAGTQKFGAQEIRKTYDIGWRPAHFVVSTAASIPLVMVPAGIDKAEGIVSAQYLKDLSDPAWKDDKGAAEYLAWMAQNMPGEDPANDTFQIGFSEALTLVHVLEKCGDRLTRANVMKQAADIRNLPLPMLLPGITLNTSATNFHPIRAKQLIRFHNGAWQRIGAPIGY